MRAPYGIILIITLMFAGTYWFNSVSAVCKVPVEWAIGELDDRFNLSAEEARSAVDDAVSIWEDATDRNLFTYNPEADFTIDFVFDDRQRTSNEADDLKDELDAKESVNEQITETYEELIVRYETKQVEFEKLKNAFERDLATYNAKVAKYNEEGGAPPDVYQSLQAEQNALDIEQAAVAAAARSLNALGTEINQLGERGNALVEAYNEEVDRYNVNYGYREGFTQGDYQGDHINIYKFSSRGELTLVLAHELGHALSLDHVDNEESLMFYLLGEQPLVDIVPTEEDLAHFAAMCGQQTVGDRFRDWLATII